MLKATLNKNSFIKLLFDVVETILKKKMIQTLNCDRYTKQLENLPSDLENCPQMVNWIFLMIWYCITFDIAFNSILWKKNGKKIIFYQIKQHFKFKSHCVNGDSQINFLICLTQTSSTIDQIKDIMDDIYCIFVESYEYLYSDYNFVSNCSNTTKTTLKDCHMYVSSNLFAILSYKNTDFAIVVGADDNTSNNQSITFEININEVNKSFVLSFKYNNVDVFTISTFDSFDSFDCFYHLYLYAFGYTLRNMSKDFTYNSISFKNNCY